MNWYESDSDKKNLNCEIRTSTNKINKNINFRKIENN